MTGSGLRPGSDDPAREEPQQTDREDEGPDHRGDRFGDDEQYDTEADDQSGTEAVDVVCERHGVSQCRVGEVGTAGVCKAWVVSRPVVDRSTPPEAQRFHS